MNDITIKQASASETKQQHSVVCFFYCLRLHAPRKGTMTLFSTTWQEHVPKTSLTMVSELFFQQVIALVRITTASNSHHWISWNQ